MSGKFIRMQKRRTSEVKFHHDVAPGIKYAAIDKILHKDAPIYIALRKVRNVKTDQPEYIDTHVHTVDSLYLFIGEEEGLKGLKAVVRIGSEEKEIESPMTVFIPKDIPHSYKLIGGSGIYISILLHGDYNAHTFDSKYDEYKGTRKSL